jgi:Flp pilus assembly pilin Flp
LAGERGQGTVEYVGLILLVSLLMVGMVAAMKGFNRSLSKAGHNLAGQADGTGRPVR